MPIPRLIFCLLAATALVAGGCGDAASTAKTESIDTAFTTVAALQIETAVGYSEAILKTSGDEGLKKFAQNALDERAAQQKDLAALSTGGDGVDSQTAARELDLSFEDLAITASGRPLSAPSGDAAYAAAMAANLYGSIRAAEVAIDGGTGTTAALANRIKSRATAELQQLRTLTN